MSVKLDSNIQQCVDHWLQGLYDPNTKSEIRRLVAENPNEIINAFYTNLSFGTGGLRSLMGVGPNRMNVYSIMSATQGLANYIHKHSKPVHGYAVFIGYDSRHNSKNFADVTARVLAGNGIHVFLYSELRPTPLISFGCRVKQCIAAVIITASHNPPEYNGYKIYWSDGGQIISPHDQGIIDEYNAITDIGMVKIVDTIDHALIENILTDVDDNYLKMIKLMQYYPTENSQYGDYLKIVYTSLHGSGITLMPQALAAWGFNNVVYVEDQCIPDGDFPTVHSPNPEEPEALTLGIQCLKECLGDILIATDPDADRVGVVVSHKNDFHILTGNQIACLCLEHICHSLSTKRMFPERAAVVKTIGTTELFQAIADRYQCSCFNVLTGFKYIAGKICDWEQDPEGFHFVFGAEESMGYLLGSEVRDKDAISSGVLIAEVALKGKLSQGKTLVDLLHDLFRRYGTHHEELVSIKFDEGQEGKLQMQKSLVKLRRDPPTAIMNIPVMILEDYQQLIRFDFTENLTTQLMLPQSDVLVFWLKDGTKIMVRPSGTEPKVKLYIGVVDKDNQDIDEAINQCRLRAEGMVQAVTDLILKSL